MPSIYFVSVEFLSSLTMGHCTSKNSVVTAESIAKSETNLGSKRKLAEDNNNIEGTRKKSLIEDEAQRRIVKEFEGNGSIVKNEGNIEILKDAEKPKTTQSQELEDNDSYIDGVSYDSPKRKQSHTSGYTSCTDIANNEEGTTFEVEAEIVGPPPRQQNDKIGNETEEDSGIEKVVKLWTQAKIFKKLWKVFLYTSGSCNREIAPRLQVMLWSLHLGHVS